MSRSLSILAAATAVAAIAYGAGTLADGGPGARAGSTSEAGTPRLAAAPGTNEQTTATSVDSCTLVTEAEAAAVLGGHVTVVPNPGQCTYVAADGSARAVSVSAPDYSGQRNAFETGVAQAAGALEGSYQPVSAGDEGYAIVAPMISEGLAREGDTYVVVVLTSPSGTEAEQINQLNDLLQTSLGRL